MDIGSGNVEIASAELDERTVEVRVHGNPLPSTLIQIPINNTFYRPKPRTVVLRQGEDLLPGLPVKGTGTLALPGSLGLCLVHVPEAGKVHQLVVDVLLRDLVAHAAEAVPREALGAHAPAAVDAHLPRAVAAAAVVAHQPALVVPRGRGAAAQLQPRAVAEAHLVWNLRLEGVDLQVVAVSAGRVVGIVGVTADVEAKTLGQLRARCADDVGAETLDGWEDLLANVPLHVRGQT
ncbi:hypothetical protein VP1G_10682 [Cytospora mali]|uniref:Uncharacterized protein n=1 Tax=Cytospora mali TaxID=578113 RepID=A0A194URZ0_CYTMA|nr:hypothetical protein VP1G_10682 [Valsa mali var. pyri (nom. inval.)]